MSVSDCGCHWDSGPYITWYCDKHKEDDVEAENERLRSALTAYVEQDELHARGPLVGIYDEACAALGRDPLSREES